MFWNIFFFSGGLEKYLLFKGENLFLPKTVCDLLVENIFLFSSSHSYHTFTQFVLPSPPTTTSTNPPPTLTYLHSLSIAYLPLAFAPLPSLSLPFSCLSYPHLPSLPFPCFPPPSLLSLASAKKPHLPYLLFSCPPQPHLLTLPFLLLGFPSLSNTSLTFPFSGLTSFLSIFSWLTPPSHTSLNSPFSCLPQRHLLTLPFLFPPQSHTCLPHLPFSCTPQPHLSHFSFSCFIALPIATPPSHPCLKSHPYLLFPSLTSSPSFSLASLPLVKLSSHYLSHDGLYKSNP